MYFWTSKLQESFLIYQNTPQKHLLQFWLNVATKKQNTT